ncbi:hypothetical protein IEQ34_015077 [Dendrobium chrysotoxum]|uniref:Subtilisin-like protease SBT1.2 n=1 Tax=Dendrobium chrysotoxum TaxID=161865 RepID=A0AAV7G5N7_DENCH|nr:hypothetical protein IEQ34_015077 [Dendrobium chrysotoxum]
MASTTLLLLFSFPIIAICEHSSSLQNYIVHVRRPNNLLKSDYTSLQRYYLSFLPASPTISSSSRLLYSYSEAITGFAAQLTAEEVISMSSKPGFLRAYPAPTYKLTTTRTPTFLGLRSNTGLWHHSNQGEGIIIGMLDTGIASNHPSFSDVGIPSAPPHWKSPCQLPPSAPCNNKLIGARSFVGKNASDFHGHGSHTASTAGGNFVGNANVLGQANGTASGIAPRAHVAIYKVCDLEGCSGADLTAGFDFAIQDGIDVASLSLGGGSASFATDPIAIAGFHAFQKGITVVCAAGNDGPYSGSLSNEAPWLITVGASTLNRILKAVVRLGNGKEFVGEALFQPRNFSSQQQFPLIAPNSCDKHPAASLKGKIVLCESVTNIPAIKAAGGVAVILKNNKIEGATIVLELQPMPSSLVTFEDGAKISAYAGSAINPTAAIQFCGTVISNNSSPSAPRVAFFSSRGPSFSSAGILKPDIIAPGVNVLAAWPRPISKDSNYNGKRQRAAEFNIISGTSMATPHISGVVALLKKAHPNWSPAAIKSSIMTTADVVDDRGKPIMDEKLKPADYFALGAGHVNPEKATDPGLVYNISSYDYIRYICGVGYSDNDVTIIAGRDVSCAREGQIAEAELNYPSILVAMNATKMTVNRKVTNVGEAGSRYKVEVESPKGVKVKVKPQKLKFSEVEEEKSFSVTFKRIVGARGLRRSTQGSLRWVSAKRVVRSPIVVTLKV